MWYEDLGFDEDPLLVNSLECDLVGRVKEAEELLYRVEAGSIVVLKGDKGCGKTQLLTAIIDKYKGEGKVLYVDGKKLKNLDVKDAITKKNVILLLDNVDQLSKKNVETIKYFFDEDIIKSVIFTTRSELPFSDSIKTRVSLEMELEPLSVNDAYEIVADRLEEFSDKLPKNVLEYLWTKSEHVSQFLELCSKVLEYTQEKEKASIEDAKKVIA